MGIALLALTSPAHAAFPGQNGKIAFESGRAEPNPLTCEFSGPRVCNSEIYTVNPDGTDLTRLTSDPARDGNATWSPDGKKIAFLRFFDNPAPACGCGDVYVMNADGSDQTNLTGRYGLFAYSVAWSPSGDVAFAYFDKTGAHFATVRPDGTNLTTLFAPNQGCGSRSYACFAGDFRWSPDGQEIAHDGGDFCIVEDCFGTDDSWIRKIKPDGSGATVVRYDVAHPDWSPDSTQILFQGALGSGMPDGVMDRNGNLVRTYDVFAGNPVWSPDGKQIAFGEASGLFRMNADGSGKTQITTSIRPPGARFLEGDGRPDWQPLVGPQRSDYKNAAKFCKADREFLVDSAFTNKYGGGANAYGKCVSKSH